MSGLGRPPRPQLDQAGRPVQLGADRRYTGPDCPPELLAAGGIPQGDCAPVPWLLSSRGYAVWVRTEANGTRFDLSGERIAVSTRAGAGPLRLELLCDRDPGRTPAPLLPADRIPGAAPGVGLRLLEEPRRLRAPGRRARRLRRLPRPRDPARRDRDRLAVGDPIQHLGVQSPPVSRRARDDRGACARQGVRTVVWVTPWVNLDSRDGQIPPQPGSERLHREPAPNYAAGAAAGHFVRERGPDGGAVRDPVVDGDRARRSTSRARPPRSGGERRRSRCWRSGSRGSRPTTARATTSPTASRLADGRTGAEAAWPLGGLHRQCLQRALDEVHPGTGVLFGRSGWTGQHAIGHTWGGDQASDFWSLRVLVVATLSAAAQRVLELVARRRRLPRATGWSSAARPSC